MATDTKHDMKELLKGLDTVGKSTIDYLNVQKPKHDALLQKDPKIGASFRGLQKAAEDFKQATGDRLKEIDSTPKP